MIHEIYINTKINTFMCALCRLKLLRVIKNTGAKRSWGFYSKSHGYNQKAANPCSPIGILSLPSIILTITFHL